jgi:hypothetical protein
MVKKLLVSALFLGIILPLAAAAQSHIARFDGGIGVHPVSNVSGTANVDGSFPNVTRNIVRGVNPAGQIWVIERLRADVRADGRISVDGRGLLLGGGNGIGGNAGASVFATLICQVTDNTTTPPTVTFTLHSTTLTGVPLADDGDFRIDDVLTPAPTVCASPVLLIRNAANNGWFAAGIPKLSRDSSRSPFISK